MYLHLFIFYPSIKRKRRSFNSLALPAKILHPRSPGSELESVLISIVSLPEHNPYSVRVKNVQLMFPDKLWSAIFEAWMEASVGE